MRRAAILRSDRRHGEGADARALRHLTLLASAALGCTIIVFTFMILASLQAVSSINTAATLREHTQVARAIAAQPGDIDQITLAAMAGTLDLDHARLTTAGQTRSSEISVSIGGDRVVAWTPHLFGTTTFETVAPMRIGGGILFILIVAVIAWRVLVVGRSLDGRRVVAQRLAGTDALTGLRNRLAFDTELAARSAEAAAGGPQFMLLLADLDGLKTINDALGHATGDLVLQAVARHLREAAEPEDLVARIGGDEFAVIRSTHRLDAYIAAVRGRLATPLLHEGRPIPVGASIGVARSEDFAAAPSSLIQAADAALYRAKRSGTGNAELAVPTPAPRRHAA